MPQLHVQLQCPIHDSFRVRQVAGMFDLPIESSATRNFDVELPDLSEPWNIGVIVGPSGSGKTTIARAAFGDALYHGNDWPANKAVIDCFGDLPIKQITRTLTSVGFSSPPSWLKPFEVLSNGERFRCELARALLSGDVSPSPRLPLFPSRLTVFDEFTSVVDRTVAKIGSAAIAKAIRNRLVPVRFVAVTCHYDVVHWLAPDWVLDMSGPSLVRGRVRPIRQAQGRRVRLAALAHRGRPPIPLRISACDRSIWPLFEPHHYLSGTLHRAAKCFVGKVDGRPAAFTAVIFFPHPVRPGWREHRTVCLPDFQGVGIGAAMSDFIASLYVATGRPYFSTTSHPAMIRHRATSPLWKMHRRPRMVSVPGKTSGAKVGVSASNSFGRNTAGFEYVGPGRAKDAEGFGVLENSNDEIRMTNQIRRTKCE